MDLLKKSIIEEVRIYKKSLSEKSIESINSDFFLQETSLRLTYYGYLCVKDAFTSYEFILDTTIRPKHLIGLARIMKYPYYLSRSRLVLFSDSDAMLIKLYGDVKTFLEIGIEYNK